MTNALDPDINLFLPDVRWLMPKSKPLQIGEEISLECVSRGEGRKRPWPNITWYIGGERVSGTKEYLHPNFSVLQVRTFSYPALKIQNCRFSPIREGSGFGKGRRSWIALKKMRAT